MHCQLRLINAISQSTSAKQRSGSLKPLSLTARYRQIYIFVFSGTTVESADTSRCLLTPPEDRKCKLDYGFVLLLVSWMEMTTNDSTAGSAFGNQKDLKA